MKITQKFPIFCLKFVFNLNVYLLSVTEAAPAKEEKKEESEEESDDDMGFGLFD